jgi:two-component system sensor histidine kinase/response regulator
MMDGEIRVESRPGVGSEFSFIASFGLGQVKSNSGDLPMSGLTGLRILVVDDHPRACAILQGLVTHLGYEATVAASGAEAIKELERTPFDLVLIDCGMPKIDGFETARRFRSMKPGAAKPKFVMVTDYGGEEQVNWAIQEGLDGHVSKPVTSAALRDALLGAFGRRTLVEPDRAVWESDIRLQGAHVLLVDDNAFNRMVATELLELMGVVVTLAEHGQEALELLRQDTFDAVLMDLQMPIMDGYEATRQIRSYPALKALPVLAVTAHAMVTEREKCLALGMVDYITKPIQPEVLASTLAKWVWPRARKLRPASLAATEFDVCSVPAIDLPGISWESGMSCVGGVTSLFHKALLLFLQLNAGVAEELRLALRQGALARAAILTHTMVSAAGTIGAENLMALTRDLERAIQAGEQRPLKDPCCGSNWNWELFSRG